MPTRMVRDGILTSEPVCSLSWAEEVFYRRLMSAADDHGRFYALPKLLRSACYPLQIDKVSDSDIGKWLTALVEAALVRVYPASDGKRYLQIVKFGQRVQSKSKFPDPIAGSDGCVQVYTVENGEPPEVTGNNGLVGGVVEDEDEDVKPPVVPQGDALVAEVLSAYHEALPRCMRATTQTPKRVKRIKVADKLASTLCAQQGWTYDRPQFWSAYFGECAADPWLRGDVPNPKNANWKQNIDVLLAEDRFAGIMDRAVANLQGGA